MITMHHGFDGSGIRIQQIGMFGSIARASAVLSAIEAAIDVNTGVVFETPGTLVGGGPVTQTGTKALTVTETGWTLAFAVGDRVGDVADALRLALVNGVIPPDAIVALPANGVLTFVDPVTVTVNHFCFGEDGQPFQLQPYILDWPLRLRGLA
jgi:hypothetical protein